MFEVFHIHPFVDFLEARPQYSLVVKDTPWGFFYNPAEEGIVKTDGRIFINLFSFSLFTKGIPIKRDELKLASGNTTFHFTLQNGNLTVTMQPPKRKKTDKGAILAQVFLVEKEKDWIQPLEIPISWKKWCPLEKWGYEVTKLAKEYTHQYFKTRAAEDGKSLFEYALIHEVAIWVKEEGLFKSWRAIKHRLQKKGIPNLRHLAEAVHKCRYTKLLDEFFAYFI